MNNQDYGTFVSNYKKHTHFPRTSDEAYKTADYYTPIWRCETENEKWLRNNSWWMITIAAVVFFVYLLYPTVEWIITQ